MFDWLLTVGFFHFQWYRTSQMTLRRHPTVWRIWSLCWPPSLTSRPCLWTSKTRYVTYRRDIGHCLCMISRYVSAWTQTWVQQQQRVNARVIYLLLYSIVPYSSTTFTLLTATYCIGFYFSSHLIYTFIIQV